MDQQNVAQFLVSCLRAEGVKYVFGIPGEENIKFVRAVAASGDIRFILARHEQGASLMADIYGRLTGKAGVCTATLGPGAINLLRANQLQPDGGHIRPGGAEAHLQGIAPDC